jgi:hypothetical protein
MIYLSFDAMAWLEAHNIDWRRSAKASLHQDFGNRLWTHEFRDESGLQASIRDKVVTSIRRCYESAEVPMSMEALSSEALDIIVEALDRNA